MSGGGVSGGGVSGGGVSGGGVSGGGVSGGVSGGGASGGGSGGGSVSLCNPGNCAGCCNGNNCIQNTNVVACGINGSVCQVCPTSTTCLNGTCQPLSACNATTCASGCCDPQFGCQPGTSSNTCGFGGNQCQSCLINSNCSNKACTTGNGGPGAGCTSDQGCITGDGTSTGETDSCIPAATIWPGGYCSPACTSSATCFNGTCFNLFGGQFCMGNCTSPGAGQSNCRSGYVCTTVTVNSMTAPFGACFPNCNNAPSQICNAGTTCNALGYCR